MRAAGEDRTILSRYFSDIRDRPLLERQQEMDLAVAARAGDEEARRRLVEANLRFVVRIALEYRGRGLATEDLVGQAHVGVMEAVYRYDPSRGVRFTSYAVWWIRKAILGAIQQRAPVRLSDHSARKARRSRQEASNRPAPPASDGSVVLPVEEPSPPPPVCISLEAGEERSDALIHRLPDASAPSPEERLLQSERRRLVGSAVKDLKPQERLILALRYGLGERPCLSYGEIGRRMGLSHERIRQIEGHLKTRLRRQLPEALRRAGRETCLQTSNRDFTPPTPTSEMV